MDAMRDPLRKTASDPGALRSGLGPRPRRPCHHPPRATAHASLKCNMSRRDTLAPTTTTTSALATLDQGKAQQMVARLRMLNTQLEELQSVRHRVMARLPGRLHNLAKDTRNRLLDDIPAGLHDSLKGVQAEWLNGVLVPAALWQPPVVKGVVTLSRSCGDFNSQRTCELKRKAAKCPTWTCRATCGMCSVGWPRGEPAARHRHSSEALLSFNGSMLPAVGEPHARIPTLATPWFSLNGLNDTLSSLRKHEFSSVFHNISSSHVRSWQESIRHRQPAHESVAHRKLGACAVVGSSQSLLLREHGSQIDGADSVIRINDPPVPARLARHIGTRTTLHVNVLKYPYKNHPQMANQVIMCGVNAACWRHIGRENDRFERLSPSFHILAKWLLGITDKYRRPTTGMAAILMALHACSNVSAFGFGLLNSSCARYYGRCALPASYYSTGFHGFWQKSSSGTWRAADLSASSSKYQISRNKDHAWLLEKAFLLRPPDGRLAVYS